MAHRLYEILEIIEDAMALDLANGIETVDTAEFGAVADLYRDLMCSRKEYFEAKYYESLVDAMDKSTPEDTVTMLSNMRRGYTDGKMGKAYKTRRGYMESKDIHRGDTAEDKKANMMALEDYIKDLSADIDDMMKDMDTAERQMIKTRIMNIGQRIIA